MKSLFLAGAAELLFAPLAQAGTVNVSFSEEFTEKLTEDYGLREGEYLTRELTEDIERAFGSRMDTVGEINIVIEDARPNRPTFHQLGEEPGLSYQSFGIGGAKLSGEVLSADGDVLASIDGYRRYENDIRMVQGYATWTDANRTFSRFARKLNGEVAGS